MNENIMRLILPPRDCDTAKEKPLNRDSDRSLVLPVIILLLAEKADFFLIFALIYIIM